MRRTPSADRNRWRSASKRGDALPEGGRALVVGHSPTNEAAVLGLTGTMLAPLDKGAGALVTEPTWAMQQG